MLSEMQAGRLVRKCIRTIASEAKQRISGAATLREVGIKNAASMSSLRQALQITLARRGFKVLSRDLQLQADTVVADLITRMIYATREVTAGSQQGGRGKKATATPVITKKTAAKKNTAKAASRGPALGGKGSHRGIQLRRLPTPGGRHLLKQVPSASRKGSTAAKGVTTPKKRKARSSANTGGLSGSDLLGSEIADLSRTGYLLRQVGKPSLASTDFSFAEAAHHDPELYEVVEDLGDVDEEASGGGYATGNGGALGRSGEDELVGEDGQEGQPVQLNVAKGPTRWKEEKDVDLLELASALVTVTATPQMDFAGKPTEPNSYPLAVWLDQGPAAEGAVVEGVSVEVLEGQEICDVEVWMDCSPGFRIEDLPENAHVRLGVKNGMSNQLKAKLLVVGPSKGQPMYVSAFFRYRGRPCGKITRFLEKIGGTLRWSTNEAEDADKAKSTGASLPAVVVEHGAEPADIRVEVTEAAARDGRSFKLKCMSGSRKWEGSWTLPQKSDELVTAYMEGFKDARGKARIAALKGAGQAFWDVLPDEAKALIRDAMKEGAKSMSIVSEEPYVPWELMAPHTTPRDAGDPLGITLQIGRWLTQKYIAPPQNIRLHSLFAISPEGSGLKTAAAELEFLLETLKDRWKPGSRLQPATVDGIDDGLAAESRDVLHFVCHGRSGMLQTLLLEASDELSSAMILALEGFLNAFKIRPLVFLNACEVGGLTAGIAGLSGFATSFMQLEASAVVAPLWAVSDQAALDVAKKFYSAVLLNGRTFTQALQDIRKCAYSGLKPSDSYAAYCFYGDPLAHAVLD